MRHRIAEDGVCILARTQIMELHFIRCRWIIVILRDRRKLQMIVLKRRIACITSRGASSSLAHWRAIAYLFDTSAWGNVYKKNQFDASVIDYVVGATSLEELIEYYNRKIRSKAYTDLRI